jgi:hydrogenase expression/formation protein HypE
VPLTINTARMAELNLECPLPLKYEHIVMAHGGGGRLMQQLLDTVIRPAFSNSVLDQQHDSAILSSPPGQIAFTTDSYVIKPLFFNGGDIGKLAVFGTVNDLAMSGAKPLYITCSFIIEEGFAIRDLHRIVKSMQSAAAQAGVSIVTGDTKVVEHGKGDGLYINTAGIGVIAKNIAIHPDKIQNGDAVIINSDIGRHGTSIMLQREGLAFDSTIVSDCNHLNYSVQALIDAGVEIHCLRDLTRGGLSSCLIELATSSGQHISIREEHLPIHPQVRSACEILGFDPLYIANEGCFVLFVPQTEAEKTIKILSQRPESTQAIQIGSVTNERDDRVTLQTTLGICRTLDLLSGEQLPRIC